jgi:hypothetical protein
MEIRRLFKAGRVFLLIGLMVVGLTLVACGGGDDDNGSDEPSTEEESTEDDTSSDEETTTDETTTEETTTEADTAADEQAVGDQLLAYGSALGPEGCQFFSSELISQLGGEAGCQKELKDSPSVTFEVVSVTVSGDTAVATMRNTESQKTQTYLMVKENGIWLINGLQ